MLNSVVSRTLLAGLMCVTVSCGLMRDSREIWDGRFAVRAIAGHWKAKDGGKVPYLFLAEVSGGFSATANFGSNSETWFTVTRGTSEGVKLHYRFGNTAADPTETAELNGQTFRLEDGRILIAKKVGKKYVVEQIAGSKIWTPPIVVDDERYREQNRLYLEGELYDESMIDPNTMPSHIPEIVRRARAAYPRVDAFLDNEAK
ncbi:MAG: hypothetical protein AAF517_26285 [Planctomycetota bacterium]